jgi:biopolymer transport protein ExbD
MRVGLSEGGVMRNFNNKPLIGVMLVLLVTLLVSLHFTSHMVTLDHDTHPQDLQPPPIDLEIERDGTVKWDGNVVSMKQLDGHLRAEAAKDPQPEIHLRADKETRYEAVGRVMYAIQRGGVKQVRFANSGKPAN